MGDFFTERRWALSREAGASLLAPHAEFDLIHMYVEDSVEAVAFESGWESSPAGRLGLMAPAYPKSIWFQQQRLDGATVVSTVQLVLDFRHYPVRGREQVEHIMDMILRPLWEQDAEP